MIKNQTSSNEFFRVKLILILLYLSFISLGLPDTILGVAWPKMRLDFSKGLEYGGFLLTLTTIVSVAASLLTGFITGRLQTGVIITICGFLTAAAMLGYGLSATWSALIFFTLIFGLGQGAVDTAVNAYMAKNYSSRNMSWVHSCWGLGAFGGPLIMTAAFSADQSWRLGYFTLAILQTLFSLIFLCTLKFWPKNKTSAAHEKLTAGDQQQSLSPDKLAHRPFLISSCGGIFFYLFYPGIEVSAGLWGASYLIEKHSATPAQGALALTIFWGALTVGRFLNGFLASFFANKTCIRLGLSLATASVLLLCLAPSIIFAACGLSFLGLGLAGLYPSMMHDTPSRLGEAPASRIIGFQVGAALAGAALFPALVGLAAKKFSLSVLGPALLFFIVLVFICHEISYKYSLYKIDSARHK